MASSDQSSALRQILQTAAGLVYVVGATFATVPAFARDASVCMNTGLPVEYSMEVNQGKVISDHSLDKRDLSALFSRRHDSVGNTVHMNTGMVGTVGLTESSLEIATSTTTRVRPAQGGGYCANLKSVRLIVGYPELRVYIPREYDVGSCAFNVVREHEMEHVAISRAVLTEYAPRLKEALANVVANINPFWAPTRDAAKEAAARIIQKALEPAVLELKAEHRRRNKAIDHPENYRALQARCAHW